MRECGACSLCCKVLRFRELDKPANELCVFCRPGRGCMIYSTRPQACREYKCFWLKTPGMPDEMRPDRVGLFVEGSSSGEVTIVRVDADRPDSWKRGGGKDVVEGLSEGGHHVLVAVGRNLTFVPGKGRPVPDKLIVDWLL